MTDPIAALLATCPANPLIREVNVHADHDTVTVTHVYDRVEYERYAAESQAEEDRLAREVAALFDPPKPEAS